MDGLRRSLAHVLEVLRTAGPGRLALWTASTLGALLGFALLGLTAAYATLDVPRARDTATRQSTVLTWAGGAELTRLGQVDRQVVRLGEMSQAVQQAVISAEDRRYYEHSGVSLRAAARAFFANVDAGEVVQGGSTLTQQYAENAYVEDGTSLRGKAREALLALKLGRARSKDEVLEDYLNTVYFGRGAYGVQVAAQTYFGVPAAELDHAQGAVLAALLRAPGLYDPADDPEAARSRWDYVVDGYVDTGALTRREADALTYPEVLPEQERGAPRDGPDGYVVALVEDELARTGLDEELLDRGGVVVETTLRRQAQRAAVQAVEAVVPDPRATSQHAVQGALVAVRPGTGEVFAYYGGGTGRGGFDYARQGPQDPGSTMKVYALAAALDAGLGLDTPLDGSSPREFPGYPGPVQNYGGADPGRVDLLTATVDSVNTAYLELTARVGADRVAQLARAAGIREEDPLAEPDGTTGLGIALGVYGVRVLDHAGGIASFAAGGVAATPFAVREVRDGAGRVLYRAEVERRRVVGEDVAADVTAALSQVVERGTASANGDVPGREAFGKTGTTQDGRDAWMVGGTRTLVAAVWLGRGDDDPLPPGLDTGGSGAARVWSAFLRAALEGVDPLPLPTPAGIGADPTPTTGPTTGPTATPSPSPTASATPSPTPSPTPSSTPSPTPRPEVSPTPGPTAARTTAPPAQPTATRTRAPRPTASRPATAAPATTRPARSGSPSPRPSTSPAPRSGSASGTADTWS